MSVFSVTVYISLAHSPLLLLALTFDRDLIVDGSGLAAAPINISAQLVGLCPLAQKYGAIAVIAVMADFSCYIARYFFGTVLGTQEVYPCPFVSNFGHGCMHVAPSTRAYCERMCA